jgi:VWFA-related protein
MRRHTGPLIVAFLSIIVLDAQESPTFRVGSELVVVDLVVADRDGQPVGDLDIGQIQVLEDGRPQKIQFVRRLQAGRPAGPPPSNNSGAVDIAPKASPTAGNVALHAAVDGGFAILIDLTSTPIDALARTREVIARLIRDELPEGLPVMLATLGPGINVLAGFTDDRVALLQAVDKVRPPAVDAMTLQTLLENIDQQCDQTGAINTRAMSTIGRGLIADARARLTAGVDALVAMSRSLAVRAGRKQLVYFSAGYYMNPAGDVIDTIAAGVAGCQGADPERIRREIAQELASGNTEDLISQVQTAIDRANRSQVSFYAVDPRGLVTASVEAKQRVSARSAQRGTIQKIVALDQTRSIEFLEVLAGGTGGRAFVNSNDIAQGLRRARRMVCNRSGNSRLHRSTRIPAPRFCRRGKVRRNSASHHRSRAARDAYLHQEWHRADRHTQRPRDATGWAGATRGSRPDSRSGYQPAHGSGAARALVDERQPGDSIHARTGATRLLPAHGRGARRQRMDRCALSTGRGRTLT